MNRKRMESEIPKKDTKKEFFPLSHSFKPLNLFRSCSCIHYVAMINHGKKIFIPGQIIKLIQHKKKEMSKEEEDKNMPHKTLLGLSLK